MKVNHFQTIYESTGMNMHLITRKIMLLTVITILILSATGCTHKNTAPKPEKGVLDLRDWNFTESGIVALDGEWNFYWNKFLSYQELAKRKPELNIPVPETWDNYTIAHDFLPGEGFATYQIQVDTNLPVGTLLALRLKTVSSAYRVFINDKPLVEAGRIGTTVEEEKGEYTPQTAVFQIPNKEFNILIQVSNFHYARGGLWDSLYLGEADQIHNYENMLIGRENFFLGILVIMALFYMAVFFLLKELKYALYFSLLSLSAALCVDTVGEFLLINSHFPFDMVINIWYGAPGWMMLFLVMFMHELFPSVFSKTAAKIYLAVMIALQAIYIFIKPLYYTKYAFIANLSGLIAILLALAIILIGARKGYKSWLLNVISIIALFSGYLYDTLYLTIKMDNGVEEIFYWCSLTALILQMITQAQRIKNYFNNKASAELLLLQAQIKPHFLYNTINTIISVSRTDGEKARNLLIDFSQYLRRCFDFRGSDQLVSLADEIELAKAYVTIEKARFGNRLEADFRLDDNIGEIKVPILILQPIIENAIIHGILPKPEGGRVEIDIHRIGRVLMFRVSDNGVGMDNANLETLLEQQSQHIGLSNIDARIRRLYKRKWGLEIQSKLKEGTEIKWYTLIR